MYRILAILMLFPGFSMASSVGQLVCDGTVVSVLDGNSLIINCDGREKTVHIAEIVVTTKPMYKSCAQKAKRFLKSKLEGQPVQLRFFDINGRGELVASVISHGGVELSHLMVARGLATVNHAQVRSEVLPEIERMAQLQRKGLWSFSKCEEGGAPLQTFKHHHR